MTISFVCRASKARKDGLSPIELSVIVNGNRSILALDRKCTPSQFNPKTQKVRGDKEINEYLDVVRKKCFNLEMEILKRGDELTITRFVEVFKNGFQENTTLLQLFDRHNKDEYNMMVNGLVVEKTWKRYVNTRERVYAYLRTLGKNDIQLKDVTNAFCEGFHSYCLSKLKVGTANKNMKQLKKILCIAVDEGYIRVNPFKVKLQNEKLDYQPLNSEEINKIISKKIDNERLDRVRDLFIFQCHTGLAYCDMASFTKDDIKDGMIVKKRKKTEVKSVIPILDVTKRILEKYDYQLPVLSNQKYNSYLTEIQDICKIDKKITSHLARHTMATILLNKGINPDVIAKILGHSSSRVTLKVYAQMLDTTVQDNADKIAKALAI